MNIDQQKQIDIKCSLAGITKTELADFLRINKATLSREIKNKDMLKQIDNYFDSINPEINQTVSLLIKKNLDFVQEPEASYQSSKKPETFDFSNLISSLNNISESVRLNAIANERNSRNMEKMIDLITEKQSGLNKQAF
jgi:isocitrate dehydrogenase kinase/phosphatase